MNVLSDITTGIGKSVTEVEGWVADIKGKLPVLLDHAAAYENSPIVQALEGVLLPPGMEAMIARLITDAAAEAAKLTAPQAAAVAAAAPAPTEVDPHA